MNAGKVQTNNILQNVLVETKNSKNKHISHFDREVDIERVLEDDEIIELWENRTQDDRLDLAKDWIIQRQGYAFSNVTDETLGIVGESIVKYSE